jgi:hypothetical protein
MPSDQPGVKPIRRLSDLPPKPKPVERIRKWANTPTGCRGCDGVRRVVGKVLR